MFFCPKHYPMRKGLFFMPEQFRLFAEIIPYILVAEGLVLCLFLMRTNHLLKQVWKARVQKREALKNLREEVKSGTSEIPVARFEKQKKQQTAAAKEEKEGVKEYDEKEVAVLQEMMAEFFG